MATITYSTLTDLLDLSVPTDITAANAEKIIDQAIDLLNLYGNLDLPNMSGTAGAKSVSVESRQRGAILSVARAVYYGFYKGLETASAGPVNVSSPDLMSNQSVLASVKEEAELLKDFDISYG
jgi:hypothetical protein